MEYSVPSDKGIKTTSSLSSSSPSASPSSSSSSPSTNYPPPPVPVTSSPSSSSFVPSSASSPNSPANYTSSSSLFVLPSCDFSTNTNYNSPPLPAATAAVVVSPCAACKILRRRCTEECVFSPYFPPTDPLKFVLVHRVFGASNVSKSLQELPESERANAVSSMAYEANVRIRDPVYGCAGEISQLQNQVKELQSQLARYATG